MDVQIMAINSQINWKIIERIIYIATILIGIGLHFIDKAKHQAVIETTLTDIKTKVYDFDKRWQNQIELNGRVIMYIELDSSQPDPP